MRHDLLGLAAWAAAVLLAAIPPAMAQEAAAAAEAGTAASAAGADPGVPRGRRVFQRYCTVCHGTRGEGGLGPPLQAVGTRLTAAQIAHQIAEPRGTMPRLYPSPIDDAGLRDVTLYLQQLR